ncbi:NADH-quinone oxidoreductase subunit NuoG [Hydrogenovibrio sp. 3SP14C1]|uniref:NADH-quinone oxidoreductase subunit NuoG n=1 Tax=Hydrogenovibrio sp. 3SP14C1 TaxID=3038774 RepID=UPI002416045B|nr:NADH-quinone oxidoreductase subunit NuoG [Hydrogenovibrio sp. 3SP14C1]MDG4813177.1 NADH-quinone oxidoreductase subunit NuoG [Hydrogenovibrio sp. 3SP14C1]
MVKIEINGQMVEAHEGDMLIDVADDAQISIPRFCYHKKLSIAANCRMCLVEVEGAPKALPACATPVTDGMKVHTKSEKAVSAQKSVMEFLLINHPLDCPICDQGGECELQDVAMEYGDDVSQYSEAKRILGDKNIGPLIHTDMTRCIHCTRCVRFGQEIGGMMELGATGRSEWMEIGTYIEKSVTSELSGNMIDLCPVGALTSKPFRYSARPWELKSHKTIAPHDSIGSNIILHSKNNVVKRVVPDENESVNEVWISDRDRFSYEALNSDDRLLHPMIKEKGQWKQVDWETALAYAAKKLKEYSSADASKVGVLASPNATLEEFHLLQKLARAVGVENLDHRLRQTDFSLDKTGIVAPKLNHSLKDIESLDNVLLVGSYLRKEIPLLNLRVRNAHLNGAIVSAVNPIDFDFNFKLNQQLVSENLVNELAGIAKAVADLTAKNDQAWLKSIEATDAQTQVAKSLVDAKNASIMVGQIAQMDKHYAEIIKLANLIADMTSVQLNILPVSANEVGAHMTGFVPKNGLNVSGMMTGNMKAFINLGIEPEQDVQDGSLALKAMQDAECVINLTAFDTAAQRDYADIMLPISTFAETAGTFVNACGLKQSFKMAVEPQGDAKPAWKIFRVLGNMLELEGFEYTHANQVMADVIDQTTSVNLSSETIELPEDADLIGTQLISMYQADALVRRSPSLQATPDAQVVTI